MSNLSEIIATDIRREKYPPVEVNNGNIKSYDKTEGVKLSIFATMFQHDILMQSQLGIMVGQFQLTVLSPNEKTCLETTNDIIKLGFSRNGILGWPENWPVWIGAHDYYYWVPVGNIIELCETFGNGYRQDNLIEFQYAEKD